jgi:hypothetical protein
MGAQQNPTSEVRRKIPHSSGYLTKPFSMVHLGGQVNAAVRLKDHGNQRKTREENATPPSGRKGGVRRWNRRGRAPVEWRALIVRWNWDVSSSSAILLRDFRVPSPVGREGTNRLAVIDAVSTQVGTVANTAGGAKRCGEQEQNHQIAKHRSPPLLFKVARASANHGAKRKPAPNQER